MVERTPHEVTSESLLATKASIVRGMHDHLSELGHLRGVLAELGPGARRCLEHPPPSSSWVEGLLIHEMITTVGRLHGLDACRALLREASWRAQMPMLMNLVGSLLRLFGGTPHTLYSRLPDTMKLTSRGVIPTWTRTSETSGLVRITYTGVSEVPEAVHHSIAGGFEVVFRLCKVEGNVSVPVIARSPEGTTGVYTIRWK